MAYNLLINGVYWGYNPLANHLLTSWDILVDVPLRLAKVMDLQLFVHAILKGSLLFFGIEIGTGF